MSRLTAWLFVSFQRVLPKHWLTALVFRLAGIRVQPIKNFLIRRFVELYKVDAGEAAMPVPEGYDTFNDFFTRSLASGARRIDAAAGTIVSPVDGTVSAAGKIDADRLLQAKGLHYTLTDLLMTDVGDIRNFEDGSFATIYLAPCNYHRVHSPLDAELTAARYVPGDLYSVNNSTVSVLPNLFARNERLICHFETAAGPMILVFVGALHVGSITTPWTGRIRPRGKGVVREIDISGHGHSKEVRKVDLLGWFNMGSTVIVLLPRATCSFSEDFVAGKSVRMGESIGRLVKR
jgi:phosphatidylserine decarboxylase